MIVQHKPPVELKLKLKQEDREEEEEEESGASLRSSEMSELIKEKLPLQQKCAAN